MQKAPKPQRSGLVVLCQNKKYQYIAFFNSYTAHTGIKIIIEAGDCL
jgi:hypothetical protein